ncbi:Rho GTPase-activating protein 6 [Mactra antiquata]
MKHISSIESIGNLQALVRLELRELGIKVPKVKKPKRGGPKVQQDCNKGQIFGSRLSHVECVHVPDCGYVAKFLIDAADIISENIENEGVFRKSGAVTRQKEIKQQLESGKNGLDGANVHDVTALVKQFFRELPEPLFTSAYHDTFIRCFQLGSQEVSTRAVLLLCLLLPAEHLSTLRFIMKLLAKIALQAEKNKMDSTNLAVVLAPNIMHVNCKSETMKSCEEKLLQVQTSVVEMLIQHAEDVGMVDDDIAEKTAFMSEVFNTDDDLDASEDNLDDVKDNQKKEKKRKRSGSFQGFVSSIAQSITKWRKSTDGKTNTSSISQGSNVSHLSVAGGAPSKNETNEKCEDTAPQAPVYQFTATPVVRRKKTAPGTEGRAFSASKKKAILNQLPQQSTLAGTPFTPASGIKKMDIHGTKHGVHDTPSMPPRPYPTPRHSMKTPRKKLTLFSPASSTKKKRYSSSTNLSLNSAGKKTGKSKGIFRRLSGYKGEQAPFSSQKGVINSNQVGQRLAAPSSNSTSSVNYSDISDNVNKKLSDDSSICSMSQQSFSSSMSEPIIISNYDDERLSLNEGFIMTDEKEGDITRIMSEPAIAGSYQSGEYVTLNDVVGPDSSILAGNIQTPKGHSRSFSLDSTLDGSCRKSSLKRGGPNSIKVGLLQGDQQEVNKLRRSFGLDRSEMGSLDEMHAGNMSDDGQCIQLDASFDMLTSKPKHEVKNNQLSGLEVTNDNSPGSVSRCRESDDKKAASGYECDDEMENGLSTMSEGSTIFQPKLSPGEDEEQGQSDDVRKTLAQQKQESKDSLLSGASSTVSIATSFRDREMTRSISADSGKGSMCEDPRDDSCNITLDSVSMIESKDSPIKSTVASEMVLEEGKITVCPSVTVTTTDVTDAGPEPSNESSPSDDGIIKSSLINKKSVSSHDLYRDNDTDERTPTRVSRSKSLLENSLSQRKCNAKPNLQISAETHKLLARAGYIKEQKMDPSKPAFDDFAVPKSFPFIEQVENLNPRRESIIALQKNNAGKVKSNVQQFDRIVESKKEDDQFTSPYRFPNSTSRKRGQARLRIPNAFNRSDLQCSLNGSILNKSCDKQLVGVAKVPISTNLIKPSDPDLVEGEKSKSSGLTRKPSIYHAEKGDSVCGLNRSHYGSDSVSTTVVQNDTLDSTTQDDEVKDRLDDTDFTDNQKDKTNYLHGVSLDIDQSLLETINDVCTPVADRFMKKCDKNDKENNCDTEAPDINLTDGKNVVMSTPTTHSTVSYRTATNKTPVEIIKVGKAERSPIKPLKRLGVSPRSPKNRLIRSPKRIKSSNCTVFTTIPDQNDDMNNL